jgi:hypothetical protein
MKKKWWILIGVVVLVIVVFVLAGMSYSTICCGPDPGINNFVSCVAAGNPVMESYPRQCRDPISDRTFVEEIEPWKLDGISLMRHESEGYYGCYGCGEGLCVDPVVEMKVVDESSEMYCSSEFEVIGVCSEESRNVDACIEIYQPVCASVQVECVTQPCTAVVETFSNSCFACMNERVDLYVVGEC